MTFEYWIKTDCQMLIRFDLKKTPKNNSIEHVDRLFTT